MKFLIYTEKNTNGRKLNQVKSLLSKIFTDAEIKTASGKLTKSEKLEDFTELKLEDFLKSTDKETVLKFCELVNVGISQRVVESL